MNPTFGHDHDLTPGKGAPAPSPAPSAAPVETAASMCTGFDSIQLDSTFDADSTLSPSNVVDPARRLVHEEALLKVGFDMALVQALNPRIKDDTGFSNADFNFAFRLVASEDVQSLAALMLLYPDQAQARGLDLAVLRSLSKVEGVAGGVAPGGAGEGGGAVGERTIVREALRAVRDARRGELGWTVAEHEGQELVLMGGVSLPWEVSREIRQAALPGGPAGVYRVPLERLPALVTRLERLESFKVERPNELRELVARCPLPTEAQAVNEFMAVMDPSTVVLSASKVRADAWSIAWTNPFGPEGVHVRQMVKEVGGAFDGRTKSWLVPDGLAVHYLARKLDGQAGISAMAFLEALGDPTPQVEADLERVDTISLKVLRTEPDGIVVQVQGYSRGGFGQIFHPGLVDLSRQCGGRYCGADKANLIAWSNLSTYLAKAEQIPNVDASELLPAFRDHMQSVVAMIEENAITASTLAPSGKTLFPHQGQAVEFLVNSRLRTPGLKGSILGDDMGTGKSAGGAVAAHMLSMDRPNGGHVLFVCPATLRPNTAREIRKWIGDSERIQVVEASKQELDPNARWTVINYNLLAKMKDKLAAIPFDVAVLDEAHYIKERDTTWTKILMGEQKRGLPRVPGLLDAIPNVIPMTGTPMLNARPREMWMMLKAINHPLTRRGFVSFGQRFCDPKNDGWGTTYDGASNLDELARETADAYLRRMKRDILDLPPKMRNDIRIELDPEQMKAYRAKIQEFMEAARQRRAPGAGDGGANHLAQISAMRHASAVAKVPFAKEYIGPMLEEGEKVVLFSFWLDVLDDFEDHFKKAGIKVGRIDGSVPINRRDELVQEFQEGDLQLLVCQTITAGVGITLTAAQNAWMHDPLFTPALMTQAEDRLDRIGQTGSVTCHYPIAEQTLDGFMFDLLADKEANIKEFEDNADSMKEAEVKSSKRLLPKLMDEIARLEGTMKKPRGKKSKSAA